MAAFLQKKPLKQSPVSVFVRRGIVRSGNCPVGELSGRVGNCPCGELSVWGIVRVGNCPSGNCPGILKSTFSCLLQRAALARDTPWPYMS